MCVEVTHTSSATIYALPVSLFRFLVMTIFRFLVTTFGGVSGVVTPCVPNTD